MDGDKIEVDHILPKKQGGSDARDEDVSEVLVCYSLGVYETQSNLQATRVIA
jgi:hypothetical protein